MIRKIIKIDEEKCNGCGLCASACHEGAIGIVDGKAKLLREDYCDGMGDCLPSCPMNAISFEEREAPAYDAEAVKQNMAEKKAQVSPQAAFPHAGCPGKMAARIERPAAPHTGCPGSQAMGLQRPEGGEGQQASAPVYAPVPQAQLQNWPVQIKLAPINAPYFDGAHLLVAADCTAYAYANFHQDFMRNKVTLIGCPKLDAVDYAEKLTEIIARNEIKSVTVVRMEVPCCGGIENAVKRALMDSGKFLPWQVVTISRSGEILE